MAASQPVRRRNVANTARTWLALLAATGAWMAGATVLAQGPVVIYRCTDARGALTIQNNVPCPKGSKQDRRVMETPPAAAAPPFDSAPPPAPPAPPVAATPPRAPPPAPVATAVAEAPTIADADRLPPPALYECRTYNDDHYLSENDNPPPRCVTLSTVGLGGLIESSGGGNACEMKTDACQRVPDGAVCDGWRQRLREAESALRFGASEDQARTQAEFERIGRVVRESTCGR